jgi:hypothetical protein
MILNECRSRMRGEGVFANQILQMFHAEGDGMYVNRWVTSTEGTLSDKQIAYALARNVVQVRRRRRELGVPPWIYKAREWTVKEERMLGTAHDYVIAFTPAHCPTLLIAP